MSLAFNVLDCSTHIQDLMPNTFTVEVNVAAVIEPNREHLIEGYGGYVDAPHAHLHKCNPPPPPGSARSRWPSTSFKRSTPNDPNGLAVAEILLQSVWKPAARGAPSEIQDILSDVRAKNVEQRTTCIANYFAWLQLKIICLLIIKKHCITV